MEQSNEEIQNQLKQDCANNSLQALAMGYIYEERYKQLKFWSMLSRIAGFIIPALVGFLFLTYHEDSNITKWIIKIGSFLAVLQFTLAAYLTISGGEDNLVEYVELATKNKTLGEDFNRLQRYSPKDIIEFESNLRILETIEKGLLSNDTKNRISEKEKRKGFRYGHLTLGRECNGCETIPSDMKSTICNKCGNF